MIATVSLQTFQSVRSGPGTRPSLTVALGQPDSSRFISACRRNSWAANVVCKLGPPLASGGRGRISGAEFMICTISALESRAVQQAKRPCSPAEAHLPLSATGPGPRLRESVSEAMPISVSDTQQISGLLLRPLPALEHVRSIQVRFSVGIRSGAIQRLRPGSCPSHEDRLWACRPQICLCRPQDLILCTCFDLQSPTAMFTVCAIRKRVLPARLRGA